MQRLPFIGLGIALVFGVHVDNAYAHPRVDRRHDHNRDEVLDTVDKQYLVISGRVGRLIIRHKVDGQSVLDLRGLEAREIIINEKVDGQSIVQIGKTGRVWIGDKIDGQSRVEVEWCDTFHVGTKIDGGHIGPSPDKATEVKVKCAKAPEIGEIKDARVIINERGIGR